MVTSPVERSWREPVLLLDRELSVLSAACDLLLHVTPVDAPAARARFRACGFELTPELHYRPLTVDVVALRRRLHALSLEGLPAPARALFEHELHGLELRLDLLEQRNTPGFLGSSVALYGELEPELVATARDVLAALPSSQANPDSEIDAAAFARAAELELAHYRRQCPEIAARVELRDDVPSLLVARGNLLVPRSARYPRRRVQALLQHEIGTHLVTYVNGGAQPLRLLQCGLQGHEELQEGLAVFAEYLAGQLSPERLRLLAARVVAVAELTAGSSFPQVFHVLRGFGLDEAAAFVTTTRTFRGGGFTKDAVYLRGLGRVLRYFASGGELRDLLCGKLGFAQLPLLELLRRQGLVGPPLLMPRYVDDAEAAPRWARARSGLGLLDLVTG